MQACRLIIRQSHQDPRSGTEMDALFSPRPCKAYNNARLSSRLGGMIPVKICPKSERGS